MSRREPAMPFIMIAVLIDTITVGLIMPVLPAWVGSFTTTPQANAFWYGVVAFSFGVANFIAAPLLGALSDVYGRRPVLLLGIFGVVTGLVLTGLATALWMLVVARLLGGAMQANVAVANAYVADITEPGQRAKRFGYIGAMMGLGFVIGPALGGLLGSFDLRLPFGVAAAFASLNWLYGYFVLPESLAPENRRTFSSNRASVFGALARIRHLGRSGPLVLTIGVNSLAQIAFSMTWVLYTQYRFGWGPRESGLSLLAMGIITMIVQALLMGVVAKRWPVARLSLVGLAGAALGYTLFGMAREPWMLYPIMLLHASGYASVAAMQSEIAHANGRVDQGSAFGAIASVNALAGMIAPLVGTSTLTLVAGLPAQSWLTGVPMLACAGIQLFAIALAMSYFRLRPTRVTAI